MRCLVVSSGFKDPENLQSPTSFRTQNPKGQACNAIGVVVMIMVPSWIRIIIRYLIFRVPKRGP